MFAINTFKGAELNLVHSKGTDIREYQIEFLNDDCAAMDISIYDEIQIIIYAKKNGTQLLIYSTNDEAEISYNSPEDNFIYWNVEGADFEGLYCLPYYHECRGITSEGKKDLLFYGISNLT